MLHIAQLYKTLVCWKTRILPNSVFPTGNFGYLEWKLWCYEPRLGPGNRTFFPLRKMINTDTLTSTRHFKSQTTTCCGGIFLFLLQILQARFLKSLYINCFEKTKTPQLFLNLRADKFSNFSLKLLSFVMIFALKVQCNIILLSITFEWNLFRL